MIFVGNNRGNGQELARHLMSPENEHVTVHEISGFASDTLAGAFKEVEALAKGTKCQKYLYSLSINPPPKERVDTEQLLKAAQMAEKKLGLEGQSRVIVFHEKDNRRHAHVVWNRIDTEKMIAIDMVFPHRKLMDVSKDLYLEHDWELPRGFIEPTWRDPKNFTLEQWQQAKRIGQDPRELKAIIQSCWKQSDDRKSLESALTEHGLILPRGTGVDMLQPISMVKSMRLPDGQALKPKVSEQGLVTKVLSYRWNRHKARLPKWYCLPSHAWPNKRQKNMPPSKRSRKSCSSTSLPNTARNAMGSKSAKIRVNLQKSKPDRNTTRIRPLPSWYRPGLVADLTANAVSLPIFYSHICSHTYTRFCQDICEQI